LNIIFYFSASFLSSANTPFKPLFPAPNNLNQIPSSGSPLLFQQKTNNIQTFNPLLQQPTTVSQLSSSLIQPSIRPPSMPSAFQPPSSAFTPLNPANTHQFPLPRLPTTQGIDITNIPPPTQDFPMAQHDSQLGPPLPPLSTAIKDPNQALHPPPSQAGACKQILI
jgi:hypothetical protein